DDAYAENFDKTEYGLRRPARFEEYRGFWFMCLERNVQPLSQYLALAKDYIDLVLDQSPSGQMEIIAGVQEYDVAANWKLMVENSVDDYHLPSTHSTWLNFMANSGVKIEPPKEEGLVLPTRGKAVELGNGHFTTDNVNFRGRPVAKWIPLYGAEAKGEIDAIRSELVTRLGAERGPRSRISSTTRPPCSTTGSSTTGRRCSPTMPPTTYPPTTSSTAITAARCSWSPTIASVSVSASSASTIPTVTPNIRSHAPGG